ncbi:MAG: sugar transferase [Patescibacteria group bacterium]|nr:sugar transferase [Patescibacteria group bacterium]
MNSKFKKIILLCGDTAILYLSLYLTLFIRYRELPDYEIWQKHFGIFTLVFVIWIIIFYISDLYNLLLAVNNSKFYTLTFRSILISGLFSATFFYLNPKIGIAPKTNLVIYLFIFMLLFVLWRRIFNWLLGSYLPKNKIIFIGFNGQVKGLINTFKTNPHLGYKIFAIIHHKPIEAAGIPVITDVSQIKKIIQKQKITTVVLASDPHQSSQLRAALFDCLPLKINIINLPNFYELITGKVPLEAISEMWFLENLSEGNKTWFDFAKRVYDIIFALLLFAITFPFWLIIMVIIKLESKGPAFFLKAGSVRMGKNNKIFKVIKFRTMREEGNDRRLTKANDARITKFGSFLRKTRLDELPQVINILKGELSFVGPRPERPEFIAELEEVVPFYRERMLVKPGLSGWDQVSGEYHSPSQADTLKKLQYDLFYIKNRSIYLDLSIILKTIATVIKGGGV